MHQDRNNGNWPELKRKKQRLAFDDEMDSRSKSNKNRFAKNIIEVRKTKKINANNLPFNNKNVVDDFADDEVLGLGKKIT